MLTHMDISGLSPGYPPALKPPLNLAPLTIQNLHFQQLLSTRPDCKWVKNEKKKHKHEQQTQDITYITAFLPDLCRRYNTTRSLPDASSCECLRSISMRLSLPWRGSTLRCVLERRRNLFVAMPAFDTGCFLPTLLRHLARVPLSSSKTLPHLLLCNGCLALLSSLHFNPTLCLSLSLWQEENSAPFWFCGGVAGDVDPHLSTSWTLATAEREPFWILGRKTQKCFLFRHFGKKSLGMKNATYFQ